MSTKHKNLSTTNLKENKLFKKLKITIVVAEWNANITESLCAGAANFLLESGVKMDNITIHHVPGTFELPLACKWAANKTNADAIIALGCVIQGETRHFEFICDATANGIMQAGLDTGIPIVFGVLTTENMKQATERAGGKHGNKGVEAAETALKMCLLHQKF